MKNKHGIKEMVTRYLKEGSTEDNARARVADKNQPKNRERALRNMMQVILRSQPRPPYTGPKRRATDTGKVVEELDPEQYKRRPRESKRDYLDRVAQYHRDTTKATDINSGDEGADPDETITQRDERRKKNPQKDWTEYEGTSLREMILELGPVARQYLGQRRAHGFGSHVTYGQIPVDPARQAAREKAATKWRVRSRPGQTPQPGTRQHVRAKETERAVKDIESSDDKEAALVRADKAEAEIDRRTTRHGRQRDSGRAGQRPENSSTEYEGPSLSEQAEYIARFLESVSWEEQHAEALKKAQGQPTFSPKSLKRRRPRRSLKRIGLNTKVLPSMSKQTILIGF